MSRFGLALPAVAVFLAFVSPAMAAATLPLADLSCKQFTGYNKENTSIILTWLNGFYADRDAPMVIDFDRMTDNAATLERYCADHPDVPVSKAAEQLLGK